ncbi:MAG: hypothetical protein HKP36_09435 [Myxococcales bacterium]|nr:hypothetical protein [Deltaproteobacteria bacterium]NNK44734.1 hypothetical protein [Myxococcales bacterium]NNL24659.1 hypothetical protein [Myxococcales bacterium]
MTIAAVRPAAWRDRSASETLPSAAGEKSLRYSIVGVLLSVEMPKALDRVQRVEYVISELWSEGAFLDETGILEAYRGELSPAGSGEIDLGDGPVPTDRWEAAIEDVPALEYLIELIALDSEGDTVCAVEREVDLRAASFCRLKPRQRLQTSKACATCSRRRAPNRHRASPSLHRALTCDVVPVGG